MLIMFMKKQKKQKQQHESNKEMQNFNQTIRELIFKKQKQQTNNNAWLRLIEQRPKISRFQGLPKKTKTNVIYYLWYVVITTFRMLCPSEKTPRNT